MQQAPEHLFILFGATGDLARRKLYPALLRLWNEKRLPNKFALLGIARRPYHHDSFREQIRQAIEEFAPSAMPVAGDWQAFLERAYYCSADATKPEDFPAVASLVKKLEAEQGIPTHRLFYLAMAPELFAPVADQLQASGLTDLGDAPVENDRQAPWKRLIIEKPFGRDRTSAEILNQALRRVFAETEIFRIDHYLGKEMVQNIEVLRFANALFEPIWNHRNIASVQITSSETVGVEERAAYYDKAGALRDMVQNHVLQMVMMMAMEPPSRLKVEAIRDEKVKVLRSLRTLKEEEVYQHVVRGQYRGGSMWGQAVQSYRKEPGVQPQSSTETFVAARLFIDNFRWTGVPFYLRTGKRMATKATEIVVQFHNMPNHLYFNPEGQLQPNLLSIQVSPKEGISIRINAKQPGTDAVVVPVVMDFCQQTESPEAYERLLLDAMHGDATFFTRWDEVQLAWKFVDPIADAFTDHRLPLEPYAAGTWGPAVATQLPVAEGYQWWPLSTQTHEEGLLHEPI
ncbi:glucose-6-phosphate dehydrogenase [Alicyclobacillaceae bacterium I2511]|nr:glucose-6-phosphate dehydrogenase [Alicyclobacillaceae bacterium I2511]